MCTGLLCSVVEPVRADVVIAPTALTIGIPTGQTTAWGSITATNTGVAAATITWNDAIHCLQGLTQVTHTLAAGASSTFTIEGVCSCDGPRDAERDGGANESGQIPVSISQVAMNDERTYGLREAECVPGETHTRRYLNGQG